MVAIEEAEEEEEEEVAAAEEEEEEEAVEAAVIVVVIVITKTRAVTSAKTWIISSRSTPDTDIESVTRITGKRQGDIREVAVGIEETVETGGIPAEIIVRITVKVTARITIISSRNILVKGTPTEVTIGVVVATIKTGEKAAAAAEEAEEAEEVAESRVVGTKVAITRIATNVVATREVEAEDNIEYI